jgi:hypothetical protein
MAYGMAVWFVMYFVVLPLSNFYPKQHVGFSAAIEQIVMHIFLVGLPISVSNQRIFR